MASRAHQNISDLDAGKAQTDRQNGHERRLVSALGLYVMTTERPDRNLALELVRTTESAAMAASRWVGRGDKLGADGAAVDAMRKEFSAMPITGEVIIGEGEKDEAPELYVGEVLGTGGNRAGPPGKHGYGDKAAHRGLIFERASQLGNRHSMAIRADRSLWAWGRRTASNRSAC